MRKTPSYLKVAHHAATVCGMGLYYNCWISEDVIIQLIEKHSNSTVTKTMLRKVYSSNVLQCVDMLNSVNSYGVFRRMSRHKQEPKKNYFYFTLSSAGVLPIRAQWRKNSITSIDQLNKRHTTRSYAAICSKEFQITPAKKVKFDVPLPQVFSEDSNNEDEDDECTSVTVMTKAEILSRQTKWDSPEAQLLMRIRHVETVMSWLRTF
jgi:hypothetical protein